MDAATPASAPPLPPLSRRRWLRASALAAGAACAGLAGRGRASERPNVLLVSMDDLGDWPTPFGGYPGTVHTPHIERLAARGTTFRRAYCAVPNCNGSRAAFFSNVHALESGLHGFEPAQANPVLASTPSLPERFRAAGYEVLGGGKLFHAHYDYRPREARWDGVSRTPLRWNPDGRVEGLRFGGELLPGTHASALEFDEYFSFEGVPMDFPDGKLNTLEAPAGTFDWGVDPEGATVLPDRLLADWAAERLARSSSNPFFLAVGFYLPHLPWILPPESIAPYAGAVHVPSVPNDALDGVPPAGWSVALRPDSGRSDHFEVLRAGAWADAVRHYLAAITFADAQLGRLLDALDAGPNAGNTIVVLWSDHGWHLGEKFHWRKFTLWERATHVPLVVAAPGAVAGGVHDAPVSLLDVHPTLVDLCLGAPPATRSRLSGRSLRAALEGAAGDEDRVVVSSLARGARVDVAGRDGRWRYIGYGDGSEELYDLHRDPEEHFNLLAGADEPERHYASTLARFREAVRA